MGLAHAHRGDTQRRALARADGFIVHKTLDARRRAWNRTITNRVAGFFRDEFEVVSRRIRTARHPDEIQGLADLTIDTHEAVLWSLYQRLYQDVGAEFAAQSFRDVLAGKAEPPTDDFIAGVVRSYLNTVGAEKVVGVSEATKRKIAATLADGLDAGENISKLYTRIDELYLDQIIPHRSAVIARTEVIQASNHGSRTGAKATGLDLEKGWIATLDPLRTRAAHLKAHGQKRRIDSPYRVMAQALMFPGDTSLGASANNTIQCRCTEGYRPAPPSAAVTVAGSAAGGFGASVRGAIGGGIVDEAQARRVGALVRREWNKRLAAKGKPIIEVEAAARAEFQLTQAAARSAHSEAVQAGITLNRATDAAEAVARQAWQDAVEFSGKRQAELRAASTDLTTARLAVQDVRNEVFRDTLSEVRELGGQLSWAKGSTRVGIRDGNKLSQFLPSDWIALSNAYENQLQIKLLKGRGWYKDFDVKQFRRLGRVSRLKVTGFARVDATTFFHEMGHRFEYVNPNILALEKEFYARRTAGKPLRRLGGGYKRSEVGRDGGFVDRYMGKQYPNDRAFELLSMGQEIIISGQTKGSFGAVFDIDKDGDFLDFVFGLLAGA